MSNDFRETILRVHGTERVIRTKRRAGGTVKQLEAAHTKAVKAAVQEMFSDAKPAYAERMRKASRDEILTEVELVYDYHMAQVLLNRYPGAAGTRSLAETLVARFEKRRPVTYGAGYASARRPHPKVRYTEAPAGLASGLTEVAPGEFIDATDDAPKSYWLRFWQ